MNMFESEWRARFERFAQAYADEAEISGWSEVGLRRRVGLFSALLSSFSLPATARSLDLGCGGGTYVRLLAGLGHRAIGLDYSLPSLARAVAADPGSKGAYVAGEAYTVPFGNESFHLVVSLGVLQALSDPERALDEMVRVLSHGGLLVVEALNSRSLVARVQRMRQKVFRLPPRVRTYEPRQLRRWLSIRGLHVERQVGLWLPPRRLPHLERFLKSSLVVTASDACPGLAEAMAHACWFVARKPGTCVKDSG